MNLNSQLNQIEKQEKKYCDGTSQEIAKNYEPSGLRN